MFDSLYSATSNLEGCPCGAHDSLASHNAFAKLAALKAQLEGKN